MVLKEDARNQKSETSMTVNSLDEQQQQWTFIKYAVSRLPSSARGTCHLHKKAPRDHAPILQFG